MTELGHVEAIENELKQIESSNAWNQVYQVLCFLLPSYVGIFSLPILFGYLYVYSRYVSDIRIGSL